MNLINKNTFVMLAGLVLLALQFTAHADVTFVHTDHLGTPVAYSDAQGNVMGEESTTPFGESLNPPTSDDLPAFTGHVRDGSTGLVYMQARYYDPVVGRFLSTDPVGFESGGVDYFNRYSYVANNPIARVDPDGANSKRAERRSKECENDPNCKDLAKSPIGKPMDGQGITIENDPKCGGIGNVCMVSHTKKQLLSLSGEKVSEVGEQLAETLVEVLEKAGFKGKVAGRLFTAVDVADLARSGTATTIKIGLRDINYYRNIDVGLHQPSQRGSLIDWGKVNWNQFGAKASISNEQVMANFINHALNQ